MEEIDYTSDDHKISIPVDSKEFNLVFKFYSEAVNSVQIKIIYSFTQDCDKETDKKVI
jgi:hypothetical protein